MGLGVWESCFTSAVGVVSLKDPSALGHGSTGPWHTRDHCAVWKLLGDLSVCLWQQETGPFAQRLKKHLYCKIGHRYRKPPKSNVWLNELLLDKLTSVKNWNIASLTQKPLHGPQCPCPF